MTAATKNLPVAVPDGFEPSVATPTTASGASYLTFISSKAKAYPRVVEAIKGVREGEPILILPEPDRPLRFNPVSFWLLGYERFWGKYDEGGSLVEYTPQEPPKEARFTEVYETSLIILDKAARKLYPAQCTFKGAKAKAAGIARLALDKAKTPAWGEQGGEYQATLQLPKPWMRFVVTAAPEPERTTKDKRKIKYIPVGAVVNPTGVGEAKLLAESLKDADFVAAVNASMTATLSRISYAKEKAS